jgi:predicted RNA-binding protein with PIN domain
MAASLPPDGQSMLRTGSFWKNRQRRRLSATPNHPMVRPGFVPGPEKFVDRRDTMALHIIVDGYNLIRNSAALNELDRQDIQLGREALVDMLAAYKKVKHHKITVVFDGSDAPVYCQSRDHVKGIMMKFSRAGETADDVIKRMAAHDREKALIVSSDRDIVAAAAACRAATISTAEFEQKLFMAGADGSGGLQEGDNSKNRTFSTQKKGPRRRAPKSRRRNRERTGKL